MLEEQAAQPKAAYVRNALHGLQDLRLEELLGMTHGLADSVHEAIDLIYPLLTRRLVANWQALHRHGTHDADVVRLLPCCVARFEALPGWERAGIEAALHEAAREAEVDAAAARGTVTVCLLFDHSRLPLFDATAYLGRAESVRRLRAMRDHLNAALLIG